MEQSRSTSPPVSIEDFDPIIQSDFKKFIKEMAIPFSKSERQDFDDNLTAISEYLFKLILVSNYLPSKLTEKIKNKTIQLAMERKITDEQILDYFLAKDPIFWLKLVKANGIKNLETYVQDKYNYVKDLLQNMVDDEMIDEKGASLLFNQVFGEFDWVNEFTKQEEDEEDWVDEYKSESKTEKWVEKYESPKEPTLVEKLMNFFVSPIEQKIIKEQVAKLTEEQKKFINNIVLSSKSLLKLSQEEKRKMIAKFIIDLTKQGRNPSKY